MGVEKPMSDEDTGMDSQDDSRLELACAFAAARFQAELGEHTMEFGVGEPVPEIEERLEAPDYAFLTAWNPDAREQPVEANSRSDDALATRLAALGVDMRRAWAQDAEGGHREAGWLVAGLGRARADRLGREFGQAGILFWRRGDPVALHMLEPPPADADASGLEDVDWVE
jgi:hypothetical protein